jgi:hypothetical protein
MDLDGLYFGSALSGADIIDAVQDGLDAQGYSTARAPALDNLDATVSSRLATAGYTAPDNAGITSISGRLPSALDGGKMVATVGAYQSGQVPLQPTVAGRTLDVSAGGAAGVDWANVESPTTTVGLTGTTVDLVNAPNATARTAFATTIHGTAVPGSFAAGTAGYLVGNNLGDLYHADIDYRKDDANSQDEYTVTWFKNMARITAGITSPTIQVVKRVDGTDRIASTAMSQIGTTGSYKYDEASNRLTSGEAYLVIVSATIDAGSRTFAKVVGRDSSAS